MEQEENFTVDEQLNAFFRDLLSKQEPLGKEFAQVLDDNYWVLLVRTPKNNQDA